MAQSSDSGINQACVCILDIPFARSRSWACHDIGWDDARAISWLFDNSYSNSVEVTSPCGFA